MIQHNHPRPQTSRSPGRPREFVMDRALDRAILTFRAKGYTAATIDDLSRGTGLTAGSLYKAFTDKRTLFLAAFERYVSLSQASLRQRLVNCASGRERLREVLLRYVDTSQGAEGRLGCLVVGSAVGLDTFDPELASRITEVLLRNEAGLAALVEQGKADGSISAAVDSAAAARLMLCILLGMRVAAKTGRDRQSMAAIVALALKVLD